MCNLTSLFTPKFENRHAFAKYCRHPTESFRNRHSALCVRFEGAQGVRPGKLLNHRIKTKGTHFYRFIHLEICDTRNDDNDTTSNVEEGINNYDVEINNTRLHRNWLFLTTAKILATF